MTSPIKITYISDKFFLWDCDAIFNLRTKHRICGQLVGSLPRKPWQSSVHSTPLILSRCEAHFCFKNGIAEISDGKSYFSKRNLSEEEVDEYDEKRHCNEEDQIKIFKAERDAKKILYYGRKKKAWKKKDYAEDDMNRDGDGEDEFMNDELDLLKEQDDSEINSDKDSVNVNNESVNSDIYKDSCNIGNDKRDTIDNDNVGNENTETKLNEGLEINMTNMDKNDDNTKNESLNQENSQIKWENIELTNEDIKYYNGSVRVHIPSSFVDEKLFETFSSTYPMTEKEKCKCVVFEDIHKRGYYTTSALKFGGDFLVYLGDPLRHHSHYIILVLDRDQELSVKEMITYGRLAAAVKKTVVLATLKEDFSCVEYLSLTWAQMK